MKVEVKYASLHIFLVLKCQSEKYFYWHTEEKYFHWHII